MAKILRRELIRNGDILLELHAGKKRDIWHMRIRVPGKNDYIRKSSHQSDLGEAMLIAQAEYDAILDRLRRKLPHKELTYSDLYKRWRELRDNGKSAVRNKVISSHHNHYILPYFGKLKLSEITNEICSGYWSWREEYWQTGPGKNLKDKVVYYVDDAGANTLASEKQSFFQVLRWALKMGYLDRLPYMKSSKKRPKAKDIARPAFTIEEYDQIKRPEYLWSVNV